MHSKKNFEKSIKITEFKVFLKGLFQGDMNSRGHSLLYTKL